MRRGLRLPDVRRRQSPWQSDTDLPAEELQSAAAYAARLDRILEVVSDPPAPVETETKASEATRRGRRATPKPARGRPKR